METRARIRATMKLTMMRHRMGNVKRIVLIDPLYKEDNYLLDKFFECDWPRVNRVIVEFQAMLYSTLETRILSGARRS